MPTDTIRAPHIKQCDGRLATDTNLTSATWKPTSSSRASIDMEMISEHLATGIGLHATRRPLVSLSCFRLWLQGTPDGGSLVN